MSDTPRKDYLIKYSPIGIRPNAAFEQAVELVDALERELNAANERIKQLENVEKSHAEVLKSIDEWMKRFKSKEVKL